ncbi:unnamed protein product [Triticum turgidum subsp. durum]|uniref:Purple acid phosphatase n=1 Tax=Triticum turgidum subsp. durum TaxID=4567 RepID=A0A9R1QNL7_TRITD|nr:unnamed protein product [Triticum turgidum subsp. durum]
MGFAPSRRAGVLLVLLGLCAACSAQLPPPAPPAMLHESFAGKSEFRTVNRRPLESCRNPSPYLSINVSTAGPLPDEAFVNVTVGGVFRPRGSHWVAMITPSNSSVSGCPLSGVNYLETGDTAKLPLLCHYPVKQMKITWVSGDGRPQQVQYAGGRAAASVATTFTHKDMCSFSVLPSPAKDFGWHDPGYIHSAVMTGLQPSQSYDYRYGSDSVGWSDTTKFRTPPAAGSDETSFVIYGDMGKAPLDPSVEHYIQPGSIAVTGAVAKEMQTGKVDSIFHIGDISYATGFLVEWDFFLHLIRPLASQVSYMTAIGNHERDYAGSGSVYVTPDSGGECGVAYESYFPMPTAGKDKPWYAIEQGSIHFIVMSTEHSWSEKSEQYNWMEKDLSSVDRSRTPWVIFIGHRPMYSSNVGIIPSVDPDFVASVEPLLLNNKVDLVFFGHVHNYERTCAVYKGKCRGMPRKDASGIDTYDNSNYTAPVHAIVGAGGFSLDGFSLIPQSWSLSRISEFGYARVHATKTSVLVQFVSSGTMEIRDQFRIVKGGR